MINVKERNKIQQWLQRFSPDICKQSDLYHILSYPTRIKTLLLLKREDKVLCVSDLAIILNISVSAVSHQLGLMERANLVESTKDGKMVCYSLTPRSSDLIKLVGLKIA